MCGISLLFLLMQLMVAGVSGKTFHHVQRLVVEASSCRTDHVPNHLFLVVEYLVLVVIIEQCCAVRSVVQVCVSVCGWVGGEIGVIVTRLYCNVSYYFFTVDGGWSEWEEETECSADCGGGTVTKTRNCSNPSPSCGGRGCQGDDITNTSCNTHCCPGK